MQNLLKLSVLAAALALGSTPLRAQTTPATPSSTSDAATSAPSSPKNPAPKNAGTGKETPPTTVVVLLPVQQAGEQLGGGCWARFYDNTGYRGANLTLVGPVDIPKMEVPGSLWRDWDSVVVGPRATVTTFDNEGFHDRTARLNPGAHVADLHAAKLGWFDEVHSAKVSCG